MRTFDINPIFGENLSIIGSIRQPVNVRFVFVPQLELRLYITKCHIRISECGFIDIR